MAGDTTYEKDRLPVSRLNIRYQRMFDGAFMYAGGLHIGIEWDSVGWLAVLCLLRQMQTAGIRADVILAGESLTRSAISSMRARMQWQR